MRIENLSPLAAHECCRWRDAQARRKGALRLLAASLCLAAFAAGAEAPSLRLPDAVAPQVYQVSLILDPAKPGFTGDIVIDVDVKSPVREIWLNGHHLTLKSAVWTAGGKSRSAKTATSGEDFVSLSFAHPLPVGKARLHILYAGRINVGASTGIFRSSDGGHDYLFTQFESTDARAAFPCFDEPGYKTPWQLTLHVPAGQKAVSNTPVVRQEHEGHREVIEFQPTKPLPSYLVAFGVGPFDIVDAGKVARSGAPVRIIAPKEKADEARYAAEVSAPILTQLEDYFGIPYPYPKADQVAIPVTFGFGAMENPGLVTYAQTLILAKPDSDSIPRQRRYAEVAAHELAHQWFGDYVTTAWWDDIWLNEAFATWMQKTLTAAWKPEWNTRVDDVSDKLDVMDEDSLVSARKIRQEIVSKDDISNAFDGITYQKGAAVIAMFENYMGSAAFRTGVRQYMNKYAFGNATAQDFLAAEDGVGAKPISGPFNTFLNQAGVPLLSVDLHCGGGTPTLHLQQQRLLPLGSTGSAAQTWHFPVCLRYPAAGGVHRECTLLADESADYPLAAGNACPAWVEADDQALGYYSVNYLGSLLAALADSEVLRQLSAAERLDLLGNAKLLADAGKLPPDGALRLVEALHEDADRHVVERALELALSYRSDLVPPALLPNYERFLARNFEERARALNWSGPSSEPEDTLLLRRALVAPVATVGADAVLAQTGRELARQWLDGVAQVSPDMLAPVLNTAAYYGDRSLAERFIAKLKATQDRQVRARIIEALRHFRDPAALDAASAALLAGDIPFIEGWRVLVSGRDSPATREWAFHNVQAHYDEILAKRPSGGGLDLAALLPAVGRGLCDEASRRALNDYFADRSPQFTGGPRILAQTLEGIDLCIARKRAQGDAIVAYLNQY
jgi:alanyl aminopeptidase